MATPSNRPGTPVSVSRPLGAFWITNGAAWQSLALTTLDLPCGFTDLASAKAYYTAVTAGRGFTGLDAMSWISKADAVLAIGLSLKPTTPIKTNTEFVLYCNVNSVSKAAHCFSQLGQPYTHVQPIVSVASCKANGVSYVAMAPWGTSSGAPGAPVLNNCCMIVGWTKAPHGTLTPT